MLNSDVNCELLASLVDEIKKLFYPDGFYSSMILASWNEKQYLSYNFTKKNFTFDRNFHQKNLKFYLKLFLYFLQLNLQQSIHATGKLAAPQLGSQW